MSVFAVVGKQRSIIESTMRVVDVVVVAGFFGCVEDMFGSKKEKKIMGWRKEPSGCDLWV